MPSSFLRQIIKESPDQENAPELLQISAELLLNMKVLNGFTKFLKMQYIQNQQIPDVYTLAIDSDRDSSSSGIMKHR